MRVVKTCTTSAHPAIVWKVLADVEHWREWTPTVLSIEPLTDLEFAVGARYRVVQPNLRPAIYEVTECVPECKFTWVQRFWGGAMIADHRIRQCDEGAELELSFASTGPLGNILGKLFSRVISNYVGIEAESLRTHCDLLARSMPPAAD
jgi:carbon monoxide dehydrogenase subunit G